MVGASVARVLGEENIVGLQSAREFNHHSSERRMALCDKVYALGHISREKMGISQVLMEISGFRC